MIFSIFILLCGLVSTQSVYVTIETGFVGVEYRFNKILDHTLDPGLQFYNPVTSRIEFVETRPQKDSVTNVECGTKDGIKLMFDLVEVGNMLSKDFVIPTISRFGQFYDRHLVTDLVRHQVNVMCSKKTAHQIAIEEFDTLDDETKDFIQSENDRQNSGLQISFVRYSKPKLPPSIEQNYLALAEERTMKKVLVERHERIQVEKNNEKLVALADNQIKSQNADGQNAIMILNIRAKQEEQSIQNTMIIEAARANAEKIILEANALQSMYGIPGYVDVKKAEAIAPNQKIYYGDKLPAYYPLLNGNIDMGNV